MQYETIAVYRVNGLIDYGFPNLKDWKPVNLDEVEEFKTISFPSHQFQEIESIARREVSKLKFIPPSLENIFDPNGLGDIFL